MTKVSNFAPELIELFRRAAREEIRVRLPSHGQAVHLRQRLYMLRQAMRDEKHPLTPIAEGVSFSIVQDSSDGSSDGDAQAQAYLIARSADALFAQAIRDAGIDVSETPDPDEFAPFTSPPDTELPATHADSSSHKVLQQLFGSAPAQASKQKQQNPKEHSDD